MARRYLRMPASGQVACLGRVKQENKPLYGLILSHLERIGVKR